MSAIVDLDVGSDVLRGMLADTRFKTRRLEQYLEASVESNADTELVERALSVLLRRQLVIVEAVAVAVALEHVNKHLNQESDP